VTCSQNWLKLALLIVAAKEATRITFTPKVIKPITVPGQLGDDAKQYLIKAVQKAIEESKK
jgi:hypothetical protein